MAKKIKKKQSVASVKYTGELAKPIIEFSAGGTVAMELHYRQQRRTKLKELFKHYSIDAADPDAWAHLAIKLALDHVPGMNVRPAPKKRGRRPTWADGSGARFLRAIEALLHDKEGRTVQAAIRILQKRGEWPGNVKSLEVRYREARRAEEDHQRLYQEWKKNPDGLEIRLLQAFAVDLPEHFDKLRSEGFKLDDI